MCNYNGRNFNNSMPVDTVLLVLELASLLLNNTSLKIFEWFPFGEPTKDFPLQLFFEMIRL